MLDEWAKSSVTVIPARYAANSNLPREEDDETYETPAGGLIARNLDSPIFRIDTLEQHAARGHGQVTSVSAGNNVILVGTNRGWLIRHDYGGGDTSEFDLNASRGVDHTVHKVFIDPGGRHALASVCSNGGAENYYIHAKWKKPRQLSKLKGLLVNSVAWNKHQISDASTRDVLLGTSTGQLFELSVEEKDKKEKYINKLFELTEMPASFVGVQMETVGTGPTLRYMVMAATPSRLYTFVGNGSLEETFQAYEDQVIRFTELPGDLPNSELHFFGKQRRLERFAWLAGLGIYYGHINLSTQQSNEDNIVEQKSLLKYSGISGEANTVKPCSLALTEFHFLVLYGQSLKVVNIQSQEVVEELRLDGSLSSSSMLGLCSDSAAGVYYAYNESSIFEISVNDEGRDMWIVYLNMKEYAAALEHCRDVFQRDQVYATQALAAFKSGDYDRAASFYAKANTVATFEEVALKFVSAGEQDALRTYLLRKLDHLGKDDRAQITMISTWASELYLDKINRLLMGEHKQKEEGSNDKENAEYQATLTEFHAFLSDCKDVLDEATTVKLLGSYGRVDELVYFAGLKEQYETLVHHFIQQGDARKALAVLRKPNVAPELQYKFGPALIMLDPHATVESWMAAGSLSPRRLIPALMRYSSEPPPKDEPNAGIRYLEFCVQRQQNEDSAIHNLLLSLYAKQDDEGALLLFLDSKYGPGRSGRFYDPKYALRLCLEEKRMRACVFIYSMMGMHEEAVALALQIDPELAKAQADKVEESDSGLRRKLWLMVARHVIQQERGVKAENIRKAVAFLKETDGLLKIEDILPFFPDFSLIDDFKEAICASLEDYTKQIEELKRQMNDATLGADNIRRDISSLTQRYAIVNQDEVCGVCGKLILASKGSQNSGPPASNYTSGMAPFYVFPCEHSFHAQCLTDYVMTHNDKYERDRITDLRNKFITMINEAPVRPSRNSMNNTYDEQVSADGQIQPIDQVRAQLDDAVAGECPFCGELMVREITQPFISEEEQELTSSWAIGSGSLAKEYGLM